MSDAQQAAATSQAAEQTVGEVSLLDQIVDQGRLARDPEARERGKNLDDFSPENVARQVKPLRELLELRSRMQDLRGNLQGNDKLEELLLEAVGNTEKLDKLKGEIKGA